MKKRKKGKTREIKNVHSYKIENSIYEEAENIIRRKTGLAVGTFLRMYLIEYIQKNK